jgi:hypothetical protein
MAFGFIIGLSGAVLGISAVLVAHEVGDGFFAMCLKALGVIGYFVTVSGVVVAAAGNIDWLVGHGYGMETFIEKIGERCKAPTVSKLGNFSVDSSCNIKDVLLRNAASAARGTRDTDSTSARHVLLVCK